MKTSKILLLGGAAYLLYKSVEKSGMFGQEGWFTEYLASVFQGDEEDGGDAVLYPIGQADSIDHIVRAANFYVTLAEQQKINTELVRIRAWVIEGDKIRVATYDGGNYLMDYDELKSVLTRYMREIATATGDWSHYTGD